MRGEPYFYYLIVKVNIVERILDWLKPLFADFGYLIVFGFAFLEHSFMVGLLIPGDVILALGALSAGRGDLNIVLVILLAFTGCVAGDNLGYFLGLKLGRPFLDRHGEFLKLGKRILVAEKYFEKHGGKTIFFSRFVTFVGTLAPPIAGMSRMRYRRFLAYDSAGAAVWSVGYGILGYFFGRNYQQVMKFLSYIGNAGLVILVLFIIVVVIAARRRREKKMEDELLGE